MTIFTADYEYDLLFRTWRIQDAEGNFLTTERMRKLASQGSDSDSKIFTYQVPDSSTSLTIDFFSPSSDINFNFRISNLNPDDKTSAITAIENDFPTRLSEQLPKVINHVSDRGDDWFERFNLNENDRDGARYFIETKGKDLKQYGVDCRLVEDTDGTSLEFRLIRAEWDGSADKKQFLASETAKEMLGILDEAGLILSDRMLTSLMEIEGGHFDNRYGNGYADMHRQLGYLFHPKHMQNRVTEIFANFDPQKAQKILDILETRNVRSSSRLWLLTAVSMLGMGKKNEAAPKFGYYESGLSMKGDGACEDGEFYAVTPWEQKHQDDSFFYFYQRPTHHDTLDNFHMSINTAEIEVDGVRLPPGFFCRVSKDRKHVEPVRLSMYGMPIEDARDAFGEQFDKVIKEAGENFIQGRDLIFE